MRPTPRQRGLLAWPGLSARSCIDAVCLALWVTAAGLVIGGRPSAAIPLAVISATATAARLAGGPVAAEGAFVALLAIDAWLTCSGLMARIDREDVAGHLILTTAVTPVLAAAIRRTLPRKRRSVRWAAMAGLATVSLAVGWELLEAGSDSLLGTNMSLSAADTTHDLLSGLVGATLGAAIAARNWPAAR